MGIYVCCDKNTIFKYFKNGTVTLIFLLICRFALAQNISVTNFKDSVFLSDVLFIKNHIAISLISNITQKGIINQPNGKYRLHSSSKFGFEGGVDIMYNFSDQWGLSYGLHVGVIPYEINFYTLSKNLGLPEDIWGKYYFEDFNVYDFAYVSIPLQLEKRWSLHKPFNLFSKLGVNIKYAPSYNGNFTDMYSDPGSGITGESLSFYAQNGKNGKVWLDYSAGAGFYKLIPNDQILKLGILVNFSFTNIFNGYYNLEFAEGGEGRYSLKGNYLGLQLTYVFTGARKIMKNL